MLLSCQFYLSRDCGIIAIFCVSDKSVSLNSYAKGDEVRSCLTCKRVFDAKFGIPPIWWTTLSRRSNGYFGYENVLDADGTLRTGTSK